MNLFSQLSALSIALVLIACSKPRNEDGASLLNKYLHSAEKGDFNSQYILGNIYNNGMGVTQDFAKAAFWYKKAAEQGDARAQYNLGVCFYVGEGVRKDEIEAYAYWNLAGATDEVARKNIKELLESKMTREEIAAGQKRSRELSSEIEAKKATKRAGE